MRIEDPEDIVRFNEYMKNPTITERGLQLIREALKLSKREKFDPPP